MKERQTSLISRPAGYMEHLTCFYPGLLVLGAMQARRETDREREREREGERERERQRGREEGPY